jgi:hypothetical protein
MSLLDYRRNSWFAGLCLDCGYNVVITQPILRNEDYWWYCSNKGCPHHIIGEHTGDMEKPEWVRFIK